MLPLNNSFLFFIITLIALVLVLSLLSIVFGIKTPDWLGVNRSKVSIEPREIIVKPDKNGQIIHTNGLTLSLPEKSLWDWLELFATIAIPVLLLLINNQFQTRQRKLEQDRLKNQRETDIYVNYLQRLGTFYRQVKTVRRSLRAAGLTTKFSENFNQNFKLSEKQIKIYNKQMKQLNQAQLGLETLKIEGKSIKGFQKIKQETCLEEALEEMEKYINSILDEYQEFYYLFDTGIPIDFSQLTCLNEFTGEIGRDFKEHIKNYNLETKKMNYLV